MLSEIVISKLIYSIRNQNEPLASALFLQCVHIHIIYIVSFNQPCNTRGVAAVLTGSVTLTLKPELLLRPNRDIHHVLYVTGTGHRDMTSNCDNWDM